jgi:quercetin dioxygenase-like cupin family protein
MTTARSTSAQAGPVIIWPGGGQVIHTGAMPVSFKVVPAQVGGAYEMHEQQIPAGTLVAPHTHNRQDQVSYVLDGVLGFLVGDREFEVPAGGMVYRPRGITHAVWNPSPAGARMLELSSPGQEMEAFFRAFDELTQARQVTAAAVAELARPYGITYDLGLVPGLEDLHGVSAAGAWWEQ